MMRCPRLPRVSLMIAALAVTTLMTAGAALALRPAPSPTGPTTSAQPQLSANTPANCNSVQRKGFARCLAMIRTASPGTIKAQASGPPASALGPADIQSAYKLPAGGGGQTVAIVDAYGDSHAEDDLAVFRSQYGLPPCTTANGCFRKVDQNGGTNYPADDTGWGEETSLDLDAVSAACPACNILLVQGDTPSFDSLGAAVDTAVSLGAKFVSNSYGVPGEDPSEVGYDHYYDHAGVAVVVASGDTGNLTEWPATNPNVVAVGGTRLTKDGTVARGWTESTWGVNQAGQYGSGSGCSLYEPRPDYQAGVDTNCPNNKATADIAADADPASGLATYDTLGQNGWLQVGGTSLASPLVTAMYAMAGTPAPDTYPVSYPYDDTQRADHLFDITDGANGSCGNVLCQAGPGWDGPTGLGTPNGVAGLMFGPHGHLTGRVTDQTTGAAVAGAKVSVSPGGFVARSDASGGYQIDLRAGSYDMTVQDYGYQSATKSGVTISVDQTVTQNFALTPQPAATLSGTVTDGSGHGWPLHAAITISGYPNGVIYTDPITGQYSVRLAQGDYTVSVSSDYPGYRPSTEQLSINASNQDHDVKLAADLTACTAPGYDRSGGTMHFTGWSAATPQAGWTINGTGWRFDNPGDRPPPQSPPAYQAGGDDDFAVADSGAASKRMNTTLVSPSMDLSGQGAPQLQFDTAYYAVAHGQSASVDLSVNGGSSWTTVWRQTTANVVDHVTLPLPSAAGKHAVRVRFHYIGNSAFYWAVDDVVVGAPSCVAQHGGLLAGAITDRVSDAPVDGAQANLSGAAELPGWPAGVAQATGDPALPGGYYWLFVPSGHQHLVVSATGYDTATTTVDVAADRISRHDVALTAHGS